MALVDRALRLNPSFARGWYISGGLSCWAGLPDRAIEHVKISLRLSPRARVGGTLNVLGAAHFLSQRFDEAVPNLLLAIQEDPGFPGAYRYLAASYAHMGRLEEARDVVRRLRTITPLVAQNFVPHRYAEHRELLLPVCAWRPAKRHEPTATFSSCPPDNVDEIGVRTRGVGCVTIASIGVVRRR
jgi:tetratricopeptide (TPR) repeat protein